MTFKHKEKPSGDFFEKVRTWYDGYLPPWSNHLADRFQWLVACGRLIFPEYRFKWPQLDWWNNKRFDRYLEKFKELQGMNTDRRWNLGQLMRLVDNVSGDTAECGCYKGAGSYLMCSTNAEQSQCKRLHHVFDSFEGLSAPSAIDGKHWALYDLAASEDEVIDALSDFEGSYVLHKGWIPLRFQDVVKDSFAFVHIDVDIYEPTKESVSFFYPRLSPGGILLCDDYGFTTCPGATKAIDEYLADKPEKMVAMSSGGGFLIKGITANHGK